MAIPYTRNMPHDATYWPPGSNDGSGGVTPGSAVSIKCRWQDVAVLFRDANGQETTSSSVVYVDRAVLNRGVLALGTFTGSPPAGAREIRQTQVSPSLSGAVELHKVYL